MKSVLIFIATILFAFVGTIIGQTAEPDPSIVVNTFPTEIVMALAPIIVYLTTGLINYLKHFLTGSGIEGTIITFIVVPLLSIIAAYIIHITLNTSMSFLNTVLWGLLSVFINEFLKQLKQTISGTQEKTNKDLIG